MDYGRPLDSYIRLPNGRNSNYTYEELVRSNTAEIHGIKNIPTEAAWRNIETLVHQVLQPVRERFGPIHVTSGFRTPELCRKIGSSVSSNHTRGEAADIKPLIRTVSKMQVLRWIHENLAYRELIAEYFPAGWVHVAYRAADNNRQLKLKDVKHNFARVDIDYIAKLYT